MAFPLRHAVTFGGQQVSPADGGDMTFTAPALYFVRIRHFFRGTSIAHPTVSRECSYELQACWARSAGGGLHHGSSGRRVRRRTPGIGPSRSGLRVRSNRHNASAIRAAACHGDGGDRRRAGEPDCGGSGSCNAGPNGSRSHTQGRSSGARTGTTRAGAFSFGECTVRAAVRGHERAAGACCGFP